MPKKSKKMDGKLVSLRQGYEVRYFAKKHGLDLAEAKRIIEEHGPSRRACDQAARALRAQQAEAAAAAVSAADQQAIQENAAEPSAPPVDPASA